MVIFSETFVEHPDYKIDQISNDVALVKLPKKIVYTGQTIFIFIILFFLYNLICNFLNLCRNYRTILLYEITTTMLYCHLK